MKAKGHLQPEEGPGRRNKTPGASAGQEGRSDQLCCVPAPSCPQGLVGAFGAGGHQHPVPPGQGRPQAANQRQRQAWATAPLCAEQQ